MELLQAFFDVNNTAFTMIGYQISWLELVGTIFNLACVILVARRNILTWPIGIIAVILFGALFWQINLYADVIEQVYYLVTGIVGWYMWASVKHRDSEDKKSTNYHQLSKNQFAVGSRYRRYQRGCYLGA